MSDDLTYDWFKSQFSAADLNGKSVAFKVPFENGIAAGYGKLEAAQDHRGWIRVAIIHSQMAADKSHVMGRKIFVPVEEGDKLVRNPPGSKCEFSIIAA